MAPFPELDWRRIDVWAIASGRGLTAIDPERRARCRAWLERQGYSVVSWDCGVGLPEAIRALGDILQWEAQFGYRLDTGSVNLDALSDGFQSDAWPPKDCVFEINNPEVAWAADQRWFRGLLSIAQGQSARQLALGHRFFTLLVLGKHSSLIGQAIEETQIPWPFWNPAPTVHNFEW